jgi:pimeloyl-ACP methyl ester carboxylesterase
MDRQEPRVEGENMATYVLVHGGGHGGWCYQRVARLLRAAGHEVHTPTLTGLGDRSHLLSPDIDLDLQIRDITAVLHYEDLRDVILVGHSYGGMVVTGAADRAADRVGKLVYLDAANPTNGQSLVDVTRGGIDFIRPHGKVIDGIELVLMPAPDAALLYGVTDPDDVAWMADRLTAHPALWAIPQYHIVCDLDPGHAGSRADGEGSGRRPALGHRHRPRPDDYRTAGGRRRAPGRGGQLR